MSSNIRAEKKQLHCSKKRKKKQQLPSSSPITSLPEDVVVDILARVPRLDYPRVSLVSKYFRSLVSSPEIYARRSSLGCTEHCLYLVLSDWDNKYRRLYILRQEEKDKGFRPRRRKRKNDKGLVLIPGLPNMPRDGSFVVVGSRIYVFDVINSYIIDCTSHTVQHLPTMPVPLYRTVADVIGGRIYVFGYTDQKSYEMVVFDTETQMWEDGMTKPVTEIRKLVVMAGKMYIRDFENSFVYDPKESKWEKEEMLSLKRWGNACVVDDVLYFYDFRDRELKAYDPEHKCWQGFDDLLAETPRVGCGRLQTVSYGGKLFLLYYKQDFLSSIKESFFVKISLERREGGQIWGKVDQWCDHGLVAGKFFITKSLDVVL